MTTETRSANYGTFRDAVGWIVVVGLAGLAYALSERIGPLNAVVAALILGLLTGNLFPAVQRSDAVATFMLKRVLKFAVILLGAGVHAGLLSQVNVALVAIIVVAIGLALVIARFAGRLLGLSPGASLLIGVGTAICGASAIAAVAPILKSKKEDVVFALGTIFIFNALALIVLPVIGFTVGMDAFIFGAWAGIAVHDTAAAVATGFAYSADAGETATLVKLTRTLFLIPLVVILAVHTSMKNFEASSTSVGRSVMATFPLFVLGFVATVTANTLGLLGAFGGTMAAIGRLLIVGVVVAIGLSLQVAKIRAVGRALAITGLVAALGVASVSFTLITSLL